MLLASLSRRLRGVGISLLSGLVSLPNVALAEPAAPPFNPFNQPLPPPDQIELDDRPPVIATGMPTTGPVSFGLEKFDTLIPQFLEKWDVPGASLAIVRNERLVFARSYGLANVESGEKVQPQSRFRLASISKVITATAVLQLIDAGKLRLDDRVLDILSDLKPLPGQSFDPRTSQITIQHLLQHTAGWERDVIPDLTYIDGAVARETGLPFPIDKKSALRFMMALPLQRDPGTRYSYCNFGYMLLGEVIEKVSGQPYESYVQEHVLEPTGARGIRLGHTLLKDRADAEVHYYSFRGNRPSRSVYDDTSSGSRSDVGFSMENIAACGGWIGSAPDLARFMVAIDGLPHRPDVLSSQMEALRDTPPVLSRQNPAGAEVTGVAQGPGDATSQWFYGDGIFVRNFPGQTNFWHTGNLSGTATLMRWSTSGLGWVVLLNGRPRDPNFDAELNSMIFNAVNTTDKWPTGDLFDLFKPVYKD